VHKKLPEHTPGMAHEHAVNYIKNVSFLYLDNAGKVRSDKTDVTFLFLQ